MQLPVTRSHAAAFQCCLISSASLPTILCNTSFNFFQQRESERARARESCLEAVIIVDSHNCGEAENEQRHSATSLFGGEMPPGTAQLPSWPLRPTLVLQELRTLYPGKLLTCQACAVTSKRASGHRWGAENVCHWQTDAFNNQPLAAVSAALLGFSRPCKQEKGGRLAFHGVCLTACTWVVVLFKFFFAYITDRQIDPDPAFCFAEAH